MEDDKKPKRYYFAKLPAMHDKTLEMQRIIHFEGNEGYGIYIRLLERAVATRGYIYFLGEEGSIEEQLSFELGVPVERLKVLLKRLVDYGFCKYFSEGRGGLFVLQAQEFTASESKSAARQRKYRERKSETSQSDGEVSQNDGNKDKNKSNSKSDNKSNSKSDNDTFVENILSDYPLKDGKESARGLIQRRLDEGYSVEQLSNAVRMYAKKCEIDETPERYIKTPYNFFGDECPAFLDYINKNMDDIKPYKKKEKNQIAFQKADSRPHDYGALERQFAVDNAERLNCGHVQEVSCNGTPEGQHVPEWRSSGRGQEASCSGAPEGQ